MKETIHTARAPQAIGPYAQAVRINNLVFTSGQIPLTPEGELVKAEIKAQTEQVLHNIAAVLEAAGSSLSKVVKTTVFLKNMDDFAAFNEVYALSFASQPPARSTLEVARLPKDVLVEIETVAYIEEETTR